MDTSRGDQGGNATVLVIEDEAAIRKLTERLLLRFGYKVIVASDGQEGVDVYAEKQDEVDLVLLDMSMPRLSGIEVIERMISKNPEVRIIVSSGERFDNSQPFAQKVRGFVAKPFKIEELFGTIKQVMAT